MTHEDKKQTLVSFLEGFPSGHQKQAAMEASETTASDIKGLAKEQTTVAKESGSTIETGDPKKTMETAPAQFKTQGIDDKAKETSEVLNKVIVENDEMGQKEASQKQMGASLIAKLEGNVEKEAAATQEKSEIGQIATEALDYAIQCAGPLIKEASEKFFKGRMAMRQGHLLLKEAGREDLVPQMEKAASEDPEAFIQEMGMAEPEGEPVPAEGVEGLPVEGAPVEGEEAAIAEALGGAPVEGAEGAEGVAAQVAEEGIPAEVLEQILSQLPEPVLQAVESGAASPDEVLQALTELESGEEVAPLEGEKEASNRNMVNFVKSMLTAK